MKFLRGILFSSMVCLSAMVFGIDGGKPVGSEQGLSKSALAVNILFTGMPGFPNTPDPKNINPCGAVVYGDDLVITAAHCVKKFSALHLIFSNDPNAANATRRSVSAFEIPVDYIYTGDTQKTAHSDIALLYFKGGLPAGYKPAVFIADASVVPVGGKLNVAGFGPCKDASSCLFTMTEATVSSLKFYPDDFGLTLSNGAKAVKGDSGGPMFMETPFGTFVFGIAHGSWTFDGGSAEFYTNLSEYLDWMTGAAGRLRKDGLSRGPGWGDGSGSVSECPGGVCPPVPQVPLP